MTERTAPLLFGAALVLGLLPSCVTAQRQEQAASRTQLGQAYLREQSPASAVQIMEEAVKLDRYSFEAWQTLALAYMSHGALEESEDAFKRALSLAPDNAEILNNYGLLLMRLERRPEAIEHFQAALADLTYRSPALILTNLGYALHREGRSMEALEHLNEALRRAPNLCQAQYNRGLVYRALQDQDLALSDFQETIDRCGLDLGSAYIQAAEVMLAQGDVYGGCVYLNTLAEASPHSPLGRQAREARARSCRP